MGEQVKHTAEELSELQALPLSIKIALTKQRIHEWVFHYGYDSVYVSFSGGKDSTVLLHIVREEFPFIPAVFADTGLEYPELRRFAISTPNTKVVKPEMNFRQVIETYGYPFPSKAVAKRVHEYRNAIEKGKPLEETSAYKEFNGEMTFFSNKEGREVPSFFNKQKWKFLTEAPFKVSHKCCDVMKKNCFKKMDGWYPMTAQMASESINRKKVWLQHGCNMFDSTTPKSNPMSFWTEQDVLQYIKDFKIPIASVYGDIVEDESGKLKTTGCERTGCIFCGFGCHLEKDNGRFEQLRESHPHIYEWIMKPWDEGGLGYKEVIDWLNANGNLHIKY